MVLLSFLTTGDVSVGWVSLHTSVHVSQSKFPHRADKNGVYGFALYNMTRANTDGAEKVK